MTVREDTYKYISFWIDTVDDVLVHPVYSGAETSVVDNARLVVLLLVKCVCPCPLSATFISLQRSFVVRTAAVPDKRQGHTLSNYVENHQTNVRFFYGAPTVSSPHSGHKTASKALCIQACRNPEEINEVRVIQVPYARRREDDTHTI